MFVSVCALQTSFQLEKVKNHHQIIIKTILKNRHILFVNSVSIRYFKFNTFY